MFENHLYMCIKNSKKNDYSCMLYNDNLLYYYPLSNLNIKIKFIQVNYFIPYQYHKIIIDYKLQNN